MTGGADDEVLREFETLFLSSKKLLERKEEILRLIAERATLSEALKKSIEDAESLRVLEEYLPPLQREEKLPCGNCHRKWSDSSCGYFRKSAT